MFNALLLWAVQATSVAQLCEHPVDDPKSPSPYCVIDEELLIETPYFAITIAPRQIVDLRDEGRYLEILPAPRQSPTGLVVMVGQRTEEEILRSLAWHNCPNPRLERGRLLRCERSDDGYVQRFYAGRSGTHIVAVGYYTGPRAQESPGEEARFERMLESIVLKPWPGL